MATKYGSQLEGILVEHYGWVLESDRDPERYGDQLVVCPRTGEKFSPYDAWSIQTEREGGETGTDAPLRHQDPLRWSALRAADFIDCIPISAMNNSATASEMWMRMRKLVEFCRREGVLS